MAEVITWLATGTLGILAAVLVAGIAIGAASMHFALLPRLRRLVRERDAAMACWRAAAARVNRAAEPEAEPVWPDALDRLAADARCADGGEVAR